MTHTPEFPPPPIGPPPPPPARRSRAWLVGGGIAAALALVAATAAVTTLIVADGDPEPRAVASAAPSAATEEEPAVAETTEDAELYNPFPEPEEFTVTLKTTNRQCFGSAGCNVTVEPEMSYTGSLPLDPEQTYAITYEVKGDESGLIVETMELSDADQLTFHPVSLSTASGGTEVSAKVTSVDARSAGY